jgi:hypothetical protein
MKKNLKMVLFAVSLILLIIFAPFYSLVFAAIWLPIVEALLEETSPALLEETSPENILVIFMMSFISNVVMITLLIPILWKLYIKEE